jgi:hypothetical protein
MRRAVKGEIMFKKTVLSICLMLFLTLGANAMPLIGDDAPAFVAKTTQGTINFPEDYKGKWVILFSHPADFTPVCTTEFMTFQKMVPEFRAINTEVIGLSIDSIYAHMAWLRTIQEKIQYKDMKNKDASCHDWFMGFKKLPKATISQKQLKK